MLLRVWALIGAKFSTLEPGKQINFLRKRNKHVLAGYCNPCTNGLIFNIFATYLKLWTQRCGKKMTQKFEMTATNNRFLSCSLKKSRPTFFAFTTSCHTFEPLIVRT